ncbi:hypothetical protein IMX26_07665 [Clostridium sp. 'deep sea']|uniref:hypothetical protein n=1 Tax=Clostridium sp. 'deep sea' TaxID=2779445 RepID=UPI001896A548|nr:hypothetical protein [Clostridium sp. 'deep sea']QOR36673.1 hypothetical protein IMX26_07665 [Clostridium sp. 'deep sea']
MYFIVSYNDVNKHSQQFIIRVAKANCYPHKTPKTKRLLSTSERSLGFTITQIFCKSLQNNYAIQLP